MRITLTLSQIKKILQTERLKFPITFKGDDFTHDEFEVFQGLLDSNIND